MSDFLPSKSFREHLDAISVEYMIVFQELKRLQSKLEQNEDRPDLGAGHHENVASEKMPCNRMPSCFSEISVAHSIAPSVVDVDQLADHQITERISGSRSSNSRIGESLMTGSIEEVFQDTRFKLRNSLKSESEDTLASTIEHSLEKEKDRFRQSMMRYVGETRKKNTLTAKLKKELRDFELNLSRRSTFVHTQSFGFLSAMVNFINCVYIGVQTNSKLKNEMSYVLENAGRDLGMWQVGDIAFAVVFVLELLLRLAADRKAFFLGRERWWNFFDAIIVTASWVEIVMELLNVTRNFGVSVLRAARAIRIIRCFRTQNHTSVIDRLLQNLRTMLFALSGSLPSFISAILLLTSVMYVFALLFMSGVTGYLLSDRKDRGVVKKLNSNFGTLDKTLYSLIGTVTGGYDWSEIADPLKHVGTIYMCFFILYIVFVFCGLLNILNGIFVSSAMQVVQMDQDCAIDGLILQRESSVTALVKLFAEADRDKSFTISEEEFSLFLDNDRIKAYYTAIGFNPNDHAFIFQALDANGDGELSLEEFVEGMIRLRGPAKMVDIKAMDENTAYIKVHLESMVRHIVKLDGRVKALLRAMAPSYPSLLKHCSASSNHVTWDGLSLQLSSDELRNQQSLEQHENASESTSVMSPAARMSI